MVSKMGHINKKLCKEVRKAFPNAILIAESGYDDIKDIEDDAPFVDGFLIGHGFLNGKLDKSIIKRVQNNQ